MLTFTDLESEYLRTKLYGAKKSSRRSLAVVVPLLRAESGDRAEERLKELDEVFAELRSFGEEAVKLAENGCTTDSLEYDDLVGRAGEHSELAATYLRNRYAGALAVEESAPGGSDTAANVPASWPEGWKPGKFVTSADGSSVVTPRTPGECMYQYCFFGLRDAGEAREIKMKQQLENYRKFSDDETQLAADLQFADAWLKKARKVLKKAEKTPDDPEMRKKAAEMKGPLFYMLNKRAGNDAERKKRPAVMAAHKVSIESVKFAAGAGAPRIPAMGGASYGKCTYRGHRNDIFLLAPAKEWELYLDESAPDKKEENYATGGAGVIAGVLTDLSCPLPEQPQLHASSDATEEKMKAGDQVVQTILEHPQTGVLAMPARAYLNSGGWGSLVVSFIDLVLRMLPLDGETKLTIYVEGRDPYEEIKDFTFMRDACRYQLMHTLPERAALIHFDIRKMVKTHPRNAYPDLVAHTCCMRKGNPLAKARYRAAQWGGFCFLNYDAMQLCTLLDCYHTGRLLPAADWDMVIRSQAGESSFVAALLQTFGEEVRRDTMLWQQLLKICLGHLNSKAINLYELGRQIDYLKRFQPDDAELPPRVRLLWLTAKLAEANHRGVAVVKAEREFVETIGKLYAEDAPLCAFAVLHLAVAHTNAYEFEQANSLLESFFTTLLRVAGKAEMPDGHDSPFDLVLAGEAPTGCIAIPGLQYYAQMLSSHGQHEAFLGRSGTAVGFFSEAIRNFRNLSDSALSAREIGQTSAYLLTSLMDMDAPDGEPLSATLREYFGGELPDVARKLAADDSAEHKYHHHILLRLIHSGKAAPEVKAAYLAEKENWAFSEDGHPWELIAFYRALLLEDREERLAWMRKAYSLTSGADATLHVIGAVILGAMLLEDESAGGEFEKLTARCAEEVPALNGRLEILREQPVKRRAPLELARLILPFNFR